MTTDSTRKRNPDWLRQDYGDRAIIAAAQQTKWAMKSNLRRRSQTAATQKAKDDARVKYNPRTQPREWDGKFRKILARLKLNLGEESTQDLAKQIEKTEQAQIAGNYELMAKNSGDLLKMLNAVQDGELPKGVTKNLRQGASDLGRILAYLPLPQGQANAKVRFSDLPPASAELVRSMVKRVEDRLDPEDAKKYVDVLNSFMAGSRTMTSDEMAVNLNKLLRVLA
jgi:hypothetical protein